MKLYYISMTALIQPSSNVEQRVVLPSVTWQQYESLLATLGDYPGLRLIYLEGMLEIFMPSPEHEMLKKVIARLLERYSEEVDIPLHGYGSTTFRREVKARGLELTALEINSLCTVFYQASAMPSARGSEAATNTPFCCRIT